MKEEEWQLAQKLLERGPVAEYPAVRSPDERPTNVGIADPLKRIPKGFAKLIEEAEMHPESMCKGWKSRNWRCLLFP